MLRPFSTRPKSAALRKRSFFPAIWLAAEIYCAIGLTSLWFGLGGLICVLNRIISCYFFNYHIFTEAYYVSNVDFLNFVHFAANTDIIGDIENCIPESHPIHLLLIVHLHWFYDMRMDCTRTLPLQSKRLRHHNASFNVIILLRSECRNGNLEFLISL